MTGRRLVIYTMVVLPAAVAIGLVAFGAGREATRPGVVRVRAALAPMAHREAGAIVPLVVLPPPPRLASSDDLVERINATLDEVVPQPWRSAVPVRIVVIAGAMSWSATDGTIRVSRDHATGALSHMRAVLAQEWGHQAALRYGGHRYVGAPPDGFPDGGENPAEAWASCVSRVLTGHAADRASRCAADSVAFTASWLANGPPR